MGVWVKDWTFLFVASCSFGVGNIIADFARTHGARAASAYRLSQETIVHTSEGFRACAVDHVRTHSLGKMDEVLGTFRDRSENYGLPFIVSESEGRRMRYWTSGNRL